MKAKQELKIVKSLAPDVHQEFLSFLEDVPPGRMNRTIRKLLLDYLMYNQIGLPHSFNTMVADLCRLAELLDKAQEHTRGWHREEDEFGCD
jgi:hypothetical protein